MTMSATERAITVCRQHYGELTQSEQTALEIVSLRWEMRDRIPAHHLATVDAAAQRFQH